MAAWRIFEMVIALGDDYLMNSNEMIQKIRSSHICGVGIKYVAVVLTSTAQR